MKLVFVTLGSVVFACLLAMHIYPYRILDLGSRAPVLVYKTLLASHRQEWMDSAVDPALIDTAVLSIPDRAFNMYRFRWEHPIEEYLDLAGTGYQPDRGRTGWLVRQIDLGKPSGLIRSQIKIDKKYQRPKRKYENPGRIRPDIGLLEIPERISDTLSTHWNLPLQTEKSSYAFWRAVRDSDAPIIITEGVKKAAALLSAGYIAISVPGVCAGIRLVDEGSGTTSVQLREKLLPFFSIPRTVYLGFDNDTSVKTKQFVESAVVLTQHALSNASANTKVITLRGPEKGVDDFIKIKGAVAFDQLFRNADTFEDWKKNHPAILALDEIRNRSSCDTDERVQDSNRENYPE